MLPLLIWIGPLFAIGVYFYFVVKDSVFHPATFSYNHNGKKSGNETTHHDMVLSAVYQLGQSNLFVFSQKHIKHIGLKKKHNMNRYFGNNNHTIKIAVCNIFRSVTLFLVNKRSYMLKASHI